MLLVLGLEPLQDLEDRSGLVHLALVDVGLGELRIGEDDRAVLAQEPVDLDQLVEALDVGGIPLDHLLEEDRRPLALLAFHEALDDGEELLVGLVELALEQVHPAHLGASLLVVGLALQEAFEDALGLGDALGPEIGLAQPGHGLGVVRGPVGGVLEALDGLLVVLLDDVDPGQLAAQPHALGVDPQALLQDLEGLGQVALPVQLVRDRDVLLDRLLRVAVAGVEVGELAPHLEVGRIDVRHLLEGVARLADLPALDVLVDHDLVLALGLDHEALLRVEIGQVDVGVEGARVELVDLLPDRDRLQEEAVPRVELRDLRVLAARFLVLVQPDVEVPDLLDRVPVPGVVVDELPVEQDGLVDAPRPLFLLGVLFDLDGIDLGHF